MDVLANRPGAVTGVVLAGVGAGTSCLVGSEAKWTLLQLFRMPRMRFGDLDARIGGAGKGVDGGPGGGGQLL
jgi:hypothetical protein